MARSVRHPFVILILVGLVTVGQRSYGQDRCGTVQYTEKLKLQEAIPESDEPFEKWVREKITTGKIARTKSGPYQVPVVVHIVHKGEPVGTGANIPDAQVHSQIQVLNEDFNRLNPDVSNTPQEFAALAGSLDIEFVLAKQDPEGLATDGIVRVKGSKNQWSIDDNYELKSQSYWPAEEYLNIWVSDLTNYLGWAQLPESNLQGLENASSNRLTDGIVISYRAFGSSDHGDFALSPDFDKGRTATHETGHFFGLRHIWGDDGGGCFGSDHVDDTPNQAGPTNSCPSHPTNGSCGEDKMFQNYMDYSFDDCMNLFTAGQAERMVAILENSPRRGSLLTSPALQDPVPVPNDLGLRLVVSPLESDCGPLITPVIEVRNYGSNQITSTTIRLSINGSQSQTNFGINLGPLESTQLAFSTTSLTPGTYELLFEVISTNGTIDGNPNNNTLSRALMIPASVAVPFFENFNSLPPTWTVTNPDQNITWEIATAPRESNQNAALRIDNFNYTDAFGERDILLSPVFDLSGVPVASLVFYLAHARYGSSFDRLQIVVMTDCQPLSEGTVVYDKEGPSLATRSSSNSSFVPTGAGDWRREQISLNEFVGEPNVQLAFVAISDWGNNVYIDDVSMIVTQFDDLALGDVVSPSPVTCSSNPEPRIVVQNLGIGTVDYFEVYFQVNNSPGQTLAFNGVSVGDAQSIEVTLPPLSLSSGLNTVTFAVLNPNGLPDDTPGNDTIVYRVVVNSSTDLIPLREDFESDGDWTMVNPQGGMNWQRVELNAGNSVAFHARSNATPGDQAWLVSPVLDFGQATEASVVFDVSYRQRSGNRETLEVLISDDCGNTFEPLVDYQLPHINFFGIWTPNNPSDWQTNAVVNLDALAGRSQARVAFVVTNGRGNNLYLDSIEFFTDAVPNLLSLEEPYSIYGYTRDDPAGQQLRIIFNLEERSDVVFAISDMMGQTFAKGILQDVLNQTFDLPVEKLAAGVYIVRLKIGRQYYAERIVVSH